MTALKTSQQHTAPICRICGQEARTGREVEHIGWTGPDCSRKVAALHQTLERNGLTEMFQGRVEFDAVESEDAHGVSCWVFPAHVELRMHRAEALGLNFIWGWLERGRAECYASLPNGETPTQARKRKRIFNRAMQRLELAPEREAA